MKKRLKWLLLCLLGAVFLAAGAEGLYERVPHLIEATLLALVGAIAVLVAVHRMITI
jgi:cell division protein FtsX